MLLLFTNVTYCTAAQQQWFTLCCYGSLLFLWLLLLCCREVMTDVFLSSTPSVSPKSALFVAWGQLLAYDLSLTVDGTESFDVPCDDGDGVADVWCPLGAASDPIPFNRSDAEVVASSDASDNSSVRNPLNFATSYIDLDFVYGRSEEEAAALRDLEGGLMTMSESGVPVQNADGTWLVRAFYGWFII